jgi:hypothetical protein
VVSAFQVGRFFNGGATDIGVATSTDNGATWTSSSLPGLTATSGTPDTTGGPFERVSDASVAYDARHNVWMVSSIPIEPSTLDVPYVFVSRSTNGGTTWTDPATIPPPPVRSVNLDKNWTACGASWSTPVHPAGKPHGLGGQPVVQANGTVIVPFETLTGTIGAFRSTNGGSTWSREATVSKIAFHAVAGGLRTSPLPTAEIGGGSPGTAYVAWEDCRFRAGCGSNDIVFSSSSDGVNWTAPARVPIDSTSSPVDHFIPALAVDKASSSLALTYYYYPNAACTTATCQLDVGYISSPNGGATWGTATQLDGPMSLNDIASTSQGPMVGDYISTSFNSAGAAVPAFAVGKPHTTAFDESIRSATQRGAALPPARAALRISLRIRSRRGSCSRSTQVIAAPIAGWTAAICACISWATAR